MKGRKIMDANYMFPAVLRYGIKSLSENKENADDNEETKAEKEEIRAFYVKDIKDRLLHYAMETSLESQKEILAYLSDLASYIETSIHSLEVLLINQEPLDEKESFMQHMLRDFQGNFEEEIGNLNCALEVVTLATNVLKSILPTEDKKIQVFKNQG